MTRDLTPGEERYFETLAQIDPSPRMAKVIDGAKRLLRGQPPRLRRPHLHRWRQQMVVVSTTPIEYGYGETVCDKCGKRKRRAPRMR